MRSEPPADCTDSLVTSTPSSSTATLGRPRVGDRPRMTMRMSWGKTPWSTMTPAVRRAMSSIVSRPFRSSVSAVKGFTTSGISCRFSARLRVVTTISSKAGCAKAGATSAAIMAPIKAADAPASFRVLTIIAYLPGPGFAKPILSHCAALAGSWSFPPFAGLVAYLVAVNSKVSGSKSPSKGKRQRPSSPWVMPGNCL